MGVATVYLLLSADTTFEASEVVGAGVSGDGRAVIHFPDSIADWPALSMSVSGRGGYIGLGITDGETIEHIYQNARPSDLISRVATGPTLTINGAPADVVYYTVAQDAQHYVGFSYDVRWPHSSGTVTPVVPIIPSANRLTVSEVRDHIETDLVDAALQRLIDAADTLIIRRYGRADATKTTLAYPRGEYSDELPLPEQAASISAIEWYGGVIDAADYTLSGDGTRVLHVNGDWPISYRMGETYASAGYRVTYVAADDQVLRNGCIIDLVKLEIAYTGEKSTSVAGVTQSQRELHAAQNAILSRLQPRARAWVR